MKIDFKNNHLSFFIYIKVYRNFIDKYTKNHFIEMERVAHDHPEWDS